MEGLTSKKCVVCKGGIPPLSRQEFEKYLPEVEGWEVVDDKMLTKEFKFKDFKEVMAFVNKVADLAEREGHHPNIYVHDWNKVKFELYTHKVGGLHQNDFIEAAKIDQL